MFFYSGTIFSSGNENTSVDSGKLIGKKTGVEISKAHPENINSKNYPSIITSFVFPNSPLKDVIQAMSTDLNMNIIMDPTLGNQKISIISYSPITVAEAYQAFLSALAIHGLTIVRSGSFFKVVAKDKALQSNLRVYRGDKTINTDQFLTSIIKLRHISASSLETKMKPFIDEKSVKSIVFYPPSNTVIISDYGLNVERIRKIIKNLDVPGDDFIFKVLSVKHARAADLANTINTLLKNAQRSSYTYSRSSKSSPKGKFSNIHSLSHDERTNSLIVLANRTGITKVKELLHALDHYKNPELSGGIYVYKVKHGTAEELASTLNELLGDSAHSSKTGTGRKKGGGSVGYVSGSVGKRLEKMNTAQSFKGVKIIAEKNTNSLLVVSNKYNYETILSILKKVDISRNQVFVKSVIMELSTEKSNDWQIANYFFDKAGGGISRVGYGLSKLTDVASSLGGATLFFPLSLFLSKSILGGRLHGTTNISSFAKLNTGLTSVGSSVFTDKIEIPSLSSFIKFLQQNVGANILSTPQVMALDHKQAEVSIVDQIPVSGERSTSTASYVVPTQSVRKEKVETLLKITPHINPDVNSIRLEIEQKIDNTFKAASVPKELQGTNIAIKKRTIKTSITLKDQETAVLGGLVRESSSQSSSKIPLLGDIPFIGWLFKNSETDREKSNLIVFITPHIIRSAEEHRTILSSKLKERMKFIRQFTGKEDPYKEMTKKMLNPYVDETVKNSSEESYSPVFEEETSPEIESSQFSAEEEETEEETEEEEETLFEKSAPPSSLSGEEEELFQPEIGQEQEEQGQDKNTNPNDYKEYIPTKEEVL